MGNQCVCEKSRRGRRNVSLPVNRLGKIGGRGKRWQRQHAVMFTRHSRRNKNRQCFEKLCTISCRILDGEKKLQTSLAKVLPLWPPHVIICLRFCFSSFRLVRFLPPSFPSSSSSSPVVCPSARVRCTKYERKGEKERICVRLHGGHRRRKFAGGEEGRWTNNGREETFSNLIRRFHFSYDYLNRIFGSYNVCKD